MSSYEEHNAPWQSGQLRNRASDGSLRKAILKVPDLASSMLSEAVQKSQLVVNPWDASEPEIESGMMPSQQADSTTLTASEIMDARADIHHRVSDQLTSRLDQPITLGATPNPSLGSASDGHASTTSLIDYRSPTVGSITPPPGEVVSDDPWLATAEKLDSALRGTKLVVERPPEDIVVPDVSASLNGLSISSTAGQRVVAPFREAPSDSPEWLRHMETIKVTIAPEKAGLLFKHVNYILESQDIHAYRRSKPIPLEEEVPLSGGDAFTTPEDLDDRVARFRASLSSLIVQYRDLSILMERIARRTDGSALDFLRYHAVLNQMTEVPDCPRSECTNCAVMNSTTGQIAGGLQRIGRIMEEQAQTTFDGALESLKAHRNLLASCHDMFTRRDRALSQINIDSLLKRIEVNETKLRELRAKDPPAKELERLKGLVDQDRAEIKSQQQRQDLIRSCTWQELLYYHRQKAFLSLMYQGYISEQIRFATQFAEVRRCALSGKPWPTLYLSFQQQGLHDLNFLHLSRSMPLDLRHLFPASSSVT
ncbi:sorting nexin [Rhizophlyctis rosea]|nr:sorting nexin [Rhizophlyctis rosea]